MNYFDLIKYADFAMYTVKNTEKGRVAEFDSKLYHRDSFLLHSKEELNKLIEDESVHYVFQPIVDAHTEIFSHMKHFTAGFSSSDHARRRPAHCGNAIPADRAVDDV